MDGEAGATGALPTGDKGSPGSGTGNAGSGAGDPPKIFSQADVDRISAETRHRAEQAAYKRAGFDSEDAARAAAKAVSDGKTLEEKAAASEKAYTDKMAVYDKLIITAAAERYLLGKGVTSDSLDLALRLVDYSALTVENGQVNGLAAQLDPVLANPKVAAAFMAAKVPQPNTGSASNPGGGGAAPDKNELLRAAWGRTK